MTIKTLLGAALALALTLPAEAAPRKSVEGFENIGPGDPATAGWTFGANSAVQELPNGNHVLHADVDNWGITLRTMMGGASPWVGDRDWRAFNVLGLRLTTVATADFNTVRPVNLLLVNDSDTPNDPNDDVAFYYESGVQYGFDGTPITVTFPVPSQHTGSTPAGWQRLDLGPGSSAQPTTWDDVITDVDQIQFIYWDPEYFYIFQYHYISVDNITIAFDR